MRLADGTTGAKGYTNTQPSPAEIVNARKFKTNVPVTIRNEHWQEDDIGHHLTERQTS